MTVISLAAFRQERSPHWSGKCVCLGCRHEWVGVGPIGKTAGLDCPACDLPKGACKHPFGAQEGDLEFRCNCGCEALTAYVRHGRKWLRCMACGDDQTEAFYE